MIAASGHGASSASPSDEPVGPAGPSSGSRGRPTASRRSLREFVTVLADAGCREVAIEWPDGPVVDALLGAGLTVVAISPNQVKNMRNRYGPA